MRLYTSVLILFLVMIALPDIFFYLKLKNKKVKPVYIILHVIPALIFTALFLYIKFRIEHLQNFRVVMLIMWLYFFFLLIYIPKIIHVIFYFLNKIYFKIYKRYSPYFPLVRILTSTTIITVMLLGAFVTPRKVEITHTDVKYKNLPDAFDNFRIVQISDLHLGSYNNKKLKYRRVVELINEQNPDIVVFSGDLVNNFADETIGWENTFNKIKSKYGKFGVMGNHDYGDYSDWKTPEDKALNLLKIKASFAALGFTLLDNKHQMLKIGNDSIVLAGVENTGKYLSSRYGDLKKALTGTNNKTPVILISHDPTHWDEEVREFKEIFLTLAGHTHAAQLGVKIGNKLFSPASLVFPRYAGLYNENGQYLYVNRGLGFIGLPMQIGVRPEISVIVLKKL